MISVMYQEELDRFNDFYEARRERMLTRLRNILGKE